MRLDENNQYICRDDGARYQLILLGAATGILILVALAVGCARTPHGTPGGAGASPPPQAAAVLATPGSGTEPDPTPRGSAGDGFSPDSSDDPGSPRYGDHEADTAAAELPQAVRSPEALRAAAARDRAGPRLPPEAHPGATSHLAPPRRLELAPGPAAPDRSAARPVPLVTSGEGEQPPAEIAAAILGAYSAFWESYWEAARQPVNPEHPGIGRHSTEPLRSRTIGVLLGRAAEGIALRLPADHGAGRIVHIEGWDSDGAEVLDCFVDGAVLYDVSTGRVHNDERATVVHLALMRREGGTWRVAEVFEQAVHKGRTDGCTMKVPTHAMPPAPATAPAAATAHGDGGAVGGPQSPS